MAAVLCTPGLSRNQDLVAPQDLVVTRLSWRLTSYPISPIPTLETNMVSFHVCGVSWIPHEITVFVSDLPHAM